MRRAKSRRSNACSRSCRRVWGMPKGSHTTTSATARPRCSRRWILRSVLAQCKAQHRHHGVVELGIRTKSGSADGSARKVDEYDSSANWRVARARESVENMAGNCWGLVLEVAGDCADGCTLPTVYRLNQWNPGYGSRSVAGGARSAAAAISIMRKRHTGTSC